MNQQIEQYLGKMVAECLQQPKFVNLVEPQRSQVAEQIRQQFYKIILDTVIDNLNDEQLTELEALDPDSPEMEEKIEEFASQMPGLAQELDQKLKKESESLSYKPPEGN